MQPRERVLRTLGPWRRDRQRLPALVRFGLALLMLGLAADIASHVLANGEGASAALGHGLTLAGMLVAVLGVLQVAYRARQALRKGGGDGARADLTVG